MDEEESFVDKCIYVEGNANETEIVAYEDEEVETILIGFRMEEMHIMNCGYVTVGAVPAKPEVQQVHAAIDIYLTLRISFETSAVSRSNIFD